MSAEQFEAFLGKMRSDPSLMKRLKETSSHDEVASVAKEHGFEFSADISKRTREKELALLSEEELEDISGGGYFCRLYTKKTGGC